MGLCESSWINHQATRLLLANAFDFLPNLKLFPKRYEFSIPRTFILYFAEKKEGWKKFSYRLRNFGENIKSRIERRSESFLYLFMCCSVCHFNVQCCNIEDENKINGTNICSLDLISEPMALNSIKIKVGIRKLVESKSLKF